jgi:poly-gamma-glutamate synthase PgsB/CapB
LGLERARLDRALRRVPRRVAVTGTRGKSGVTRLVASGLRASGARVLSKTTGSRPMLILPDGTERQIERSGPASVREQVRLVSLAASMGADTLVAEMMSIGAEELAAESRRVLRPGTLAVTNVRLDHRDDQGRDKDAIARTLAAAIPVGADVFIPGEEVRGAFEEAAARRRATLHAVGAERGTGTAGGGPARPLGQFEPNSRLARAVLAFLGVDGPAAERGLVAAAPDPGGLRVWRGPFGRPPREVLCVGLFAANEPESSAIALGDVRKAVPFEGRPVIGLLSLREDRGDRTLQWTEAAAAGFFRGFAAVALLGPPAGAALRRIRRGGRREGPAFFVVSGRDAKTPGTIMDRVVALVPGEPVVVGLGNFVGAGADIVGHWERTGTPYAG